MRDQSDECNDVASPSADVVSIVIACHSLDRWTHTIAAIESVRTQQLPPRRLVIVVDHNDELLARLGVTYPDLHIISNDRGRGAAGARNTGVAVCDSEFVAFLDDDAVAEPDWLATLVAAMGSPSTVGAGGRVRADWADAEPAWFPHEFAWVVGASYRGLSTTTAPIRNVWSENMIVRRSTFLEVGGFREGIGKLGKGMNSSEDTDLCIRMSPTVEGGHWLHVPDAVVDHHVPPERSTLRYFVRRTYDEGRGKAILDKLLGGDSQLGDEHAYVRTNLTRAMPRDLKRAVVQRDVSAAGQAGAIALGISSAAAGYLVGLLHLKVFGKRPQTAPR